LNLDRWKFTNTHVAKNKKSANRNSARRPTCGLCGKTRNLTKTECCGNWICDDEHKYVLFSYARNSCSRNHRRFTLCGSHHAEEHPGDWKNCDKCRRDFETEMYVWYGTNEYNFEKLPNPPSYKPTKCSKCGTVINLSEDAYSIRGGEHGREYWCEDCTSEDMERSAHRSKRSD
jgi:hypothetical protein